MTLLLTLLNFHKKNQFRRSISNQILPNQKMANVEYENALRMSIILTMACIFNGLS